MTIQERLVRRAPEDIIEIGQILERFYLSDAGEILRAILNGRRCEEAKIHQTTAILPAERILGRIEAYQNVIDDIEQGIQDMKRLTEPLIDTENV